MEARCVTGYIDENIQEQNKQRAMICLIVSHGAVHSAVSSYATMRMVAGFAPHARHSVRMTYRPSAALRLLGSLRISHNKFLRANK